MRSLPIRDGRRIKLNLITLKFSYDIMWTIHHNRMVTKESEKCPGLDPQHTDKHDPDLEVDFGSEFDGADEDDLYELIEQYVGGAIEGEQVRLALDELD